MTHLIGDNSSFIRGDWFTLFGSVGVQCSEAQGDAIIVICHDTGASTANERLGVSLHDNSWQRHDIRDIGTLGLISSLQTSSARWILQNATELFRLRTVSQSRQWPWWSLCQWWSYWPPSHPHPSENFLKRPSLWMRISFFCSSITRTQTQQLPAPGRVDTKL